MFPWNSRIAQKEVQQFVASHFLLHVTFFSTPEIHHAHYLCSPSL